MNHSSTVFRITTPILEQSCDLKLVTVSREQPWIVWRDERVIYPNTQYSTEHRIYLWYGICTNYDIYPLFLYIPINMHVLGSRFIGYLLTGSWWFYPCLLMNYFWNLWVNVSHESTKKAYKATSKQATTKPCAHSMEYTVFNDFLSHTIGQHNVTV